MNSTDKSVVEVVRLLVQHWRSRLLSFESYLASTFRTPAPALLPHRLQLLQMVNGTIEPENIGNEYAAVWIAEDNAFRETPLSNDWLKPANIDSTGTYYNMHAYLFVLEGDELLLSEHYGPNMLHRERARLFPGPPLTAEWKTCWHTGPDPEPPKSAIVLFLNRMFGS